MYRVPRFHVPHTSLQRRPQKISFRRLSAALALGLAALLSLATLGVSARRMGQSSDAQALATSQTSNGSKNPQAQFVPGDILVRYRSDSKARLEEMAATPLQKSGRAIPVDVQHFDGSRLVEGLRLARVQPEDTLEAIAALKANPDVLYAEPNYILHKEALPNDPRFGEMWGLKNTGQSFNNGNVGTAGADIDAEQAWNITTGSSSVVVGIIDTGIDINHPDLAGNIWVNPGEIPGNGIDDDGNGRIDDVNGWDFAHNNNTVYDGGPTDPDDHGTHVAGTIGAKGNNGVGVTGINWDVRLMSLKFLAGPDGDGATSNAIAAFDYAKAMHDRGINLRVINCSWGGGPFQQSLLDAINRVGQSGILVVAAAGNGGVSSDDFPHYPSSYDASNLISVGRTNHFDNVSSTSNFGARIVNIGAPGFSILSTTPNNTYSFFSGTSMSTPHVTGVAALILSINPNIALQRLRSALIYSGEATPAVADKFNEARRLNANLALVNSTENDLTPPAISGLGIASQNGRRVTLQFSSGDDGTGGPPAALYSLTFASATGAQYYVASVIPTTSGLQNLTVDVPYKNTSGTMTLKVVDNAGNQASANIGVAVSASASEPYAVSLSPADQLSTGGDPLSLTGDDEYRFDYSLPFNFPFYGKTMSTVTISTNGALYFSPPEIRDNGDADDVPSSRARLNLQSMIAGMWDDLRTDRLGGDVFVVRPDANRIIFRWQGSTFANNTQPINFEIELRSDGTIQTRYGSGNAGLQPVVGISGGQADAFSGGPDDDYVVNSHTSTSTAINLTNAQTVTFTPQASTPTPSTLQLNQPSYNIAEGSGSLNLLVNRSGDSSLPVTVRYATSDAAAFLQNCNVINGAATSRCDYVGVLGTLHFASGETSKTISIPIVDDTYLEGAESFSISLSSPTGGALIGTNQNALISITDNGNDSASAANPIDGATFFVRQHYIDFLSREPDPLSAGWITILNQCAAGDQSCRLSVSQGIYGSPEFRDRGYFIYKFYSVSLGRKPSYDEFNLDRARVSGFQTEAELEQSKVDFINDFMSRTEFSNIYNGLTSNAYVQQLFSTAGVTQITVSGLGVQTVSSEQTLLAGGRPRAQVLRDVAESPEVSARFLTESTVVMHYFGYLRRDPDAAYQDWINILNSTGDSRNVTSGFINSPEYRARFGQ